MSPNCEKSIWRIFWQSVYVHWALRETVPYDNCVCMTVCLWLFTEVWVGRETWAWKFALTDSEMEAWNGNIRGGWGECSLWHGEQAFIMYSDGSQCLVFSVRVAGGYIPLRRWYFNNTCSICVTSFDTALRWAQEGGSDESCLLEITGLSQSEIPTWAQTLLMWTKGECIELLHNWIQMRTIVKRRTILAQESTACSRIAYVNRAL